MLHWKVWLPNDVIKVKQPPNIAILKGGEIGLVEVGYGLQWRVEAISREHNILGINGIRNLQRCGAEQLFLPQQGERASRLVLDPSDAITNQKASSSSDRPCTELYLLPRGQFFSNPKGQPNTR